MNASRHIVRRVQRSQALTRVRQAVKTRRLQWSAHALDEMDAEGETRESIASVLLRARTMTLQENGRWRVRGDGLVVILHVDADAVLVWTVYAG